MPRRPPRSATNLRAALDWGHDGAARAAGRGDVLVVVDVLSFSTGAATAAYHGVTLIPCPMDGDPAALAATCGADVAVRRRDVPALGRYSLSPQTFVGAPRGARVVLQSPNGATAARLAASVPALFAGALVNAHATARAAAVAAVRTGRSVTVLACGERRPRPGADGPLRFAVEDLLGAGAVLASLAPRDATPDAAAAIAAFRDASDALEARLLASESGAELVAIGFADDVRHAARLDEYDVAVTMEAGCLVPHTAADA